MPRGQPYTTTIRVREDTAENGETFYAVVLPAQKIACRDEAHALAAQQAIIEAIEHFTMNDAKTED